MIVLLVSFIDIVVSGVAPRLVMVRFEVGAEPPVTAAKSDLPVLGQIEIEHGIRLDAVGPVAVPVVGNRGV